MEAAWSSHVSMVIILSNGRVDGAGAILVAVTSLIYSEGPKSPYYSAQNAKIIGRLLTS